MPTLTVPQVLVPAFIPSIEGTTALHDMESPGSYTFQYPSDLFKEVSVSKVEKGANGTDTKFLSTSRTKKQQVYVVSLANEGAVGGFKQDVRAFNTPIEYETFVGKKITLPELGGWSVSLPTLSSWVPLGTPRQGGIYHSEGGIYYWKLSSWVPLGTPRLS
eukprot:1307213-Pyramimonas_sp.AAC.1